MVARPVREADGTGGVSEFALLESYMENYEQIARDHVAHWRATGLNPWQMSSEVDANEQAVVDAVRRHVAPGVRVLDVGCGMGDLMVRLRENYDVQGCDIAAAYLEVTGERGLDVVHARIEKMPYKAKSFDCVIASDVLEHVLDLNAAIRELLRVLRPGGVLIIRVPNEETFTAESDKHHYRFTHLRRFDEFSLRLFLNRVFELEILESRVVELALVVVVRKC
jgi:ubiquinone/menaquinone biosynthesis C-methylase UbiE